MLKSLAIAAFFGLLLLAAPARAMPCESEKGTPYSSVPEFDASTAGAGMALLLGGLLVLTGRRRRPGG